MQVIFGFWGNCKIYLLYKKSIVSPTFSDIKGITKISQCQEFYDILRTQTQAHNTAPVLEHSPKCWFRFTVEHIDLYENVLRKYPQ